MAKALAASVAPRPTPPATEDESPPSRIPVKKAMAKGKPPGTAKAKAKPQAKASAKAKAKAKAKGPAHEKVQSNAHANAALKVPPAVAAATRALEEAHAAAAAAAAEASPAAKTSRKRAKGTPTESLGDRPSTKRSRASSDARRSPPVAGALPPQLAASLHSTAPTHHHAPAQQAYRRMPASIPRSSSSAAGARGMSSQPSAPPAYTAAQPPLPHRPCATPSPHGAVAAVPALQPADRYFIVPDAVVDARLERSLVLIRAQLQQRVDSAEGGDAKRGAGATASFAALLAGEFHFASALAPAARGGTSLPTTRPTEVDSVRWWGLADSPALVQRQHEADVAAAHSANLAAQEAARQQDLARRAAEAKNALLRAGEIARRAVAAKLERDTREKEERERAQREQQHALVRSRSGGSARSSGGGSSAERDGGSRAGGGWGESRESDARRGAALALREQAAGGRARTGARCLLRPRRRRPRPRRRPRVEAGRKPWCGSRSRSRSRSQTRPRPRPGP